MLFAVIYCGLNFAPKNIRKALENKEDPEPAYWYTAVVQVAIPFFIVSYFMSYYLPWATNKLVNYPVVVSDKDS